MAGDNIEFNLDVNIGDSIANIRAVNSALSDFSRNSLVQVSKATSGIEQWIKTTQWAIGVMQSRRNKNIAWISDTDDQLKNLIKTSKMTEEVIQSIPSGIRQTRRASMPAGGDITQSGGISLSPTRTATRVTRPAGAPDAGSGFKQQISALTVLEAQTKSNISTTELFSNSLSRLGKHMGLLGGTSASLRYALYDVSNAAALASVAFAAFPIAMAKGAIDGQRAFVDVERTTKLTTDQTKELKKQFIDLSSSIPKSFTELSDIGKLAGQLGVANDQVFNFTKNVAMFSTVTGMSADASATAFARLNDLLDGVDGNYQALGSSILKVGVNSAATESEIIAVAQQIAPVANAVGWSAEAVVGFAGALASVKVPPELSRGLLQRTFAVVNQAISSNSSQLDKWGKLNHMSGQEFKKAWLTNSVSTFADTLRAIGQQGGAAEGTLVGLGITASRDAATIKRLAQNVDSTLIPALQNAASGYTDANEQQKQFDKISATIAEKLKTLANSFQNFIMVAGDGVGVFGGLIDAATGLFKILTDFASTPFGKWFMFINGIIASTVAVILGFIFVITRMKAGILAVNLAITGIGRELTVAKIGMARAAAQAAITGESFGFMNKAAIMAGISVKALRTALITTGIGAAVVLVSSLVASLIDMAVASNESSNALDGTTASASNWKDGAISANASTEAWAMTLDDLKSAIEQVRTEADKGFIASDAIGDAAKSFKTLIAGIKDSSGSFSLFTEAGQQNASNFKSSVLDILGAAQTMGIGAADVIDIVYENVKNNGGDVAQLQMQLNGLVTAGIIDVAEMNSIIAGTFKLSSKGQTLANAFKHIADNAKDTAAAVAEVRTLIDYANDLSSVWKRAFDIRFNNQESLDKIANAWRGISEQTQKAREEVNGLNADIQSLTADKKLKEYFLSVAEAYGDTITAAKLRADIAGIDSNLASKTQDLTDAQSASNKTLKGNSKAAIDNRNTVRGMITNYQGYIESLVKSGASQETINKAIRDGKADFVAQATQLGYNTTELGIYTSAFDDMVKVVNSVPKNVTVTFTPSMTAADKALAEFVAKAKKAGTDAAKGFKDNFNPVLPPLVVKTEIASPSKTAMDKLKNDILSGGAGQTAAQIAKNNKEGWDWNKFWSLVFTTTKPLGGYASGGYTGAGGKYEPAGVVHKGEYVVPASQVNQNTGLPYYMQQQRSFASGGFVGASGPMMVTLAPQDRALLRNIGGSGEVVLYANNEAIARSSNAGNKSIVAAGGRP